MTRGRILRGSNAVSEFALAPQAYFVSIINGFNGGRSRARTYDPLIKS